ncbi:hypothetical protein NE237_001837 [Protea cynaroides]|uniref:Major facilitator superfamily (MFS) profile domain-containing protein n=1 Tax=Protea cynaroides TaxID=273540 RepID=A0A9Q0KUX6_9MAGN|nr:hypothetical protein NE237_001837 [Protea cynaroides]
MSKVELHLLLYYSSQALQGVARRLENIYDSDYGVMSGAALFIKDDLHINNTQVEILAGTLSFYSTFGSAAVGRTSDWLRRRYTIVITAVIFFIGALIMDFTINYTFLICFVAGSTLAMLSDCFCLYGRGITRLVSRLLNILP